jgi:uncharacterized protein DUF2569
MVLRFSMHASEPPSTTGWSNAHSLPNEIDTVLRLRRYPGWREDIVTDVSSAPLLRGLGGWLALLVIGQMASLLRLVKAVADDVSALGTRHLPAMAKTSIYFELALNLVMLALVVMATVMMFQKRRLFPTLWKVQAATNLVLSLIGLVVISVLLNVKLEYLGLSLAQLAFGAVWLIAWTSYLGASERVKNTFVN